MADKTDDKVKKPVRRVVSKAKAGKPEEKKSAVADDVKQVAKKPVKQVKKKTPRVKVKAKDKEKKGITRDIPGSYKPGNLKVNLYDTKGKVVREIQLPRIFDTDFRPDLIRKDVRISRANRRQRYGPSPKAGMRHAVSQWGKGRGTARVQRLTQGNTAAESPPNVGGRRAHPPRPEHDFSLKMNIKERRLAKSSALASTADPELVRGRGHKFGKNITVPLVVQDEFAGIIQTKKVIRVLEQLKVYEDVVRATDGRHVRVGRGKMRGRKYRTPRSIIIVVPEFIGLEYGAGNLPGVEVVTPEELNTELLAPGGDPGRLVIFTEGALKLVGAWKNA